MIIDAMDILHSGVVDAFALVSSDSDYTRLATRIRETGNFCDGHRREENAKAFRQRLRRIRLHRKFGGRDEGRTSADHRNANQLPKRNPKAKPTRCLCWSKPSIWRFKRDGWAWLDLMGNAALSTRPGLRPADVWTASTLAADQKFERSIRDEGTGVG